MDKDISIIILNYNSGDFLKKCVQSILTCDTKNIVYEIIIVDNASSDGSQEIIKKIVYGNKNAKSVFNKSNLGFSKGNNVAIPLSSGNYVLFLNPDTILSKNVLKECLLFMEKHQNVGVCSAKLKLADGSLDESAHRGFPTPWNAFAHFSGLEKFFPRNKLFADYTKGWLVNSQASHEVDSVSGAFFFTRRKAGKEIDWWDEDFFWYGDDLDFCYRLKEKGWKVFFLPEVLVTHYKGVSSGIKKHSRTISTADMETKMRSIKASIQAMKIFYKKHYKNKYPSFITFLVLFGVNILKTIRIVKQKWSYSH